MSFEGKHVLVTGGSGGMGSKTAKIFAERGAAVAVHYHSCKSRALKVKKSITEHSGEAMVVQADLSRSDEAESMVRQVINRFNGLDVLVNNAATHPPPVFDIMDPDWELWMKMIKVNVMGVIAASRAAAPYLKRMMDA